MENNVPAEDLDIAPLDDTQIEPICDSARQDKLDVLVNCDGIVGDQVTQRRLFPSELQGFFNIEGAPYRVEVKQVIRDEKRVIRGNGPRQIIFTKELFFEVSVVDPLDFNEWKIRINPKRTQQGKLGLSDEDLKALAQEGEDTRHLLASSSTLGGADDERRAIEYLPEVEIEGVYKNVSPQNRRDLVPKSRETTDHSHPEVISGGKRLSYYVEGDETAAAREPP